LAHLIAVYRELRTAFTSGSPPVVRTRSRPWLMAVRIVCSAFNERSPERSLHMTRDLLMRCEPHARPRLHVRHEPVEHGDPRSMADDVRVHRQDEQSALLVRAVEKLLS
jgi:hypothetical protein